MRFRRVLDGALGPSCGGTTSEELATSLGIDPETQLGGSVWDPRTIVLRLEVRGELPVTQADWSRPAAP